MKRRAVRRRILWWIGVIGLATTSALWIIGAIRPISGASDRLGLIWHLDGGSVYLWYSTTGRFQLPPSRWQTATEFAQLDMYSVYDGRWLPQSWRPEWGSLGNDYVKSVGSKNDGFDPAFRPIYFSNAPVFWLQLPFIFALAWLLFARLPRRKPGHCQKCNYNLTGNTSGRCPECGTAIPDSKVSAVAMESLEPENSG